MLCKKICIATVVRLCESQMYIYTFKIDHYHLNSCHWRIKQKYMLFEWTRIIKIVKTTNIQNGKQHVCQKSGHFVFQDGGRYWCLEGCPHFLYENIHKELSVCQISCFYKKVNNFDVFCPLAAPLNIFLCTCFRFPHHIKARFAREFWSQGLI